MLHSLCMLTQYQGGAERLVIDAAVGLQQRGHKVTIYTSHRDVTHCFDEARDGIPAVSFALMIRNVECQSSGEHDIPNSRLWTIRNSLCDITTDPFIPRSTSLQAAFSSRYSNHRSIIYLNSSSTNALADPVLL